MNIKKKNIYINFLVGMEQLFRAPDKRGIEDNSKIIFLVSQGKHML